KFGFDPDDVEQLDYFARWYSYRFFNIYKEWYYICRNYNVLPKDTNRLSPELVSKIQEQLEKVAQRHLTGEMKEITPYPETYKKFKGKVDSIAPSKGTVDISKNITKDETSDAKSGTGNVESNTSSKNTT